jgi:hypothetical protein
MFTWLKNFLGLSTKEESVFVNQVETIHAGINVSEKEETVTTTQIETVDIVTSVAEPATTSTVDLNSMKKPELLSYAKENGIKVNASMNKEAILNAIKNA